MIINLTRTTIDDILQHLHGAEFYLGEVASDRALTLLVVCEPSNIECNVTAAIESSRHHPCRIVVFVISPEINNTSAVSQKIPLSDDKSDKAHEYIPHTADKNSDDNNKADDTNTYLDAQLRMGQDAGAGDVIILFPHGELLNHLDSLARPLLVSGAPRITWWTGVTPSNLSASPLGKLSSKHITNIMETPHFDKALANLRSCYCPGDIDLSWGRITRWRALLAAFLDIPPYCSPVKAVVIGTTPCLPAVLLAAWLQLRLKIDVTIEWKNNAVNSSHTSSRLPYSEDMTPEEILQYQACPTNYQEDHITSVSLCCPRGGITVERDYKSDSESAKVTIMGRKPQSVLIPQKTLAECLTQELSRSQEDVIYSQVITSHFPFEKYLENNNLKNSN